MAERGALFRAIQNKYRGQRMQMLADEITRIADASGQTVRILDAGGRSDFWSRLPAPLKGRVHVVVQNLEAELAYDAPPDVAIEEVVGNSCQMPEYTDGQFDLVHSNSVIEHVGSYVNMLRFAEETQRVGRRYFIQTPNFGFPVEPHYGRPFVHWRGDMHRIRKMHQSGIGYARRTDLETACAAADLTTMVNRWFLSKLYPHGEMRAERVLGLFVKSWIAIGDGTVAR